MKLSHEQIVFLDALSHGRSERTSCLWQLWIDGLIENRGGGPNDFHLTEAGRAALKEAKNA